MDSYGGRRRELRERLARREQLNASLEQLYRQERERSEQVEQLAARRWEEQADVERLEKLSLSSIFHRIAGSLDEALDREQAEAYAAALKHDAAERELAALREDIGRRERELAGLNDCQREYDALLKEKREALRAAGREDAANIFRLERECLELERQRKEIAEALAACASASFTGEQVLGELDSAHSWGVWDVMGGGLIADMAKYSHVDAAQNGMEQLQWELSRVQAEMADVKLACQAELGISEGLRMADYFFDCIFTDWAVLGRISDSADQERAVLQGLEDARFRLTQMDQDAAGRLERLQRELESLVVTAEC